MSNMMNITFLGTSSGKPTTSRNTSSLALLMDKDMWLFDCGEATQHQIQKFNGVPLGKLNKIFITHMHADHMFGLIPLMATSFNGMGGQVDEEDENRVQEAQQSKPFELYGPPGLREYVRKSLLLTFTLLGARYVVHELHPDTNPPPPSTTDCHPCEVVGKNIPSVDGIWTSFYADSNIRVDAAPILHSVFSLGFVVTEAPIPGTIDKQAIEPVLLRNKDALKAAGIKNHLSLLGKLQKGEIITLPDGTVLHPPATRQGRKIAILGDTHDASPIATIARGSNLLIHEATNAHLPEFDSAAKNMSLEEHQAWTMSRGHSTPQMAASFANTIDARALAMNHFSARYRADDEVMNTIKALAQGVKNEGEVFCAKDGMTLEVMKNGVVRMKE